MGSKKRHLSLTKVEAAIVSAGLANEELFFRDLPEEKLKHFRWGPLGIRRLKAKLFRAWPELKQEELREELAGLERLQARLVIAGVKDAE